MIQGTEVGVGEFAEALLERARGARDGLEAAHLAQDAFAVAVVADELDDLRRRAGIVTATRDGSSVVYALAGGDVTELMGAARRILSDLLSSRRELLEELREGVASP